MLQEKLEWGRERGFPFPSYKETLTVYLVVKVFLIMDKQISSGILVGEPAWVAYVVAILYKFTCITTMMCL